MLLHILSDANHPVRIRCHTYITKFEMLRRVVLKDLSMLSE